MSSSPLEHVYDVFSIYPLKKSIHGCPCCQLKDTASTLHTQALRELDWVDLGLYSFKAMTTVGGVEDFKYFLPRLLELYIHDVENEPYGLFIFFSKLKYGLWHQWPQNEQAVILAAMQYWLKNWEEKFSTIGEDWLLEELRNELDEANIKL